MKTFFSGEGKEILTSLYTVDGEAEKQKSVLLEEMGRMRLARKSRGFTGGRSLLDKEALKTISYTIGMVFVRSNVRAGKIYDREKVEWALAHFFRADNLAALRELALREVAESLDRTSPGQAASGETSKTGGAAGRLMVCISSFSPRAATLLRRGSRMAGRLNTDWYVAYVETPEEAPHLIDSEAQRYLLHNIEQARELGAIVVRLQSKDPVAALLGYARTHGVGHIMIGRSHRPWWQQVLGRSFVARMVREAADLDLHIVAMEDEEERS